jgi:uncharacterized protein (DUF305 family)
MTKVLSFSLFLFFIASACNNNSFSSENTSPDTSTGSDSPVARADMNTETSVDSMMPFKGAMEKMMREMHRTTITGDPDHDFARMMKQHHQGAIDMANTELSRGSKKEVKQVAQKIIDESQKDINDLDSFLNNFSPVSKTDFARIAMDKMMSSSSQVNIIDSSDVDHQFAKLMYLHHQLGIEMSKDYLKAAKNQNTKRVASRIIKTNSADLKKLNKWWSK